VRVLFLGTAAFAVPQLRATATQHEIVAVVTQPDRPGDRGLPAPRPVGEAAQQLGLKVLQPARVRDLDTVAALVALNADCLVVAAYGQILPAALLDGVRLGAVNVHASLLPRWRGASPVAYAILAGDAETGVSIMRTEAGLDTGPVYAQRRIAIPPDATTPALTASLAELGADLLVETLAGIEGGSATATPQDESQATYAPRLTRSDGDVEWANFSAIEIDRRVRALQPWPGVIAPIEGARVRLLEGAAINAPGVAAPGTVVSVEGESVAIATRHDAYRVDKVLPPASRPMSAAAFLRGRRTP
jgi:methionyl-tRNA formyltransferase